MYDNKRHKCVGGLYVFIEVLVGSDNMSKCNAGYEKLLKTF